MVGCPEKKPETALGNEEVVGMVVLGDVGTEEEVGDGELESSSS